jgi:hypothetical protein
MSRLPIWLLLLALVAGCSSEDATHSDDFPPRGHPIETAPSRASENRCV